MASGPSAAVADQLRALFQGGTVGGLTDGQLLERFVRWRDEAAFAALVERHGPMVLRVCRNRLGDPHDAEDAFQATFLVLARKAASIRQTEAVAGWLFGVAGRVSAKALAADRRRIRAERKAGVSPALGIEDRRAEPWTELHEEVERLPERYRLPLVLCHLEGWTYEQAAAHLRCPVRTVQSRLARGRERLRGRLERRGLAPSAAIVGPAVSTDAGRWIVPRCLKEATAASALRFTSGEGVTAGGGSAAALAGEVLHAMFLVQIGGLVRLTVLLGLIGAAGWLARTDGANPLPSPPPVRAAGSQTGRSPLEQAPSAAKMESPFRMTGTVRVEGTGEPIAGARVQVDLGTRDMSGDFREAVTDANGRYSIPLPQGNARPLFFYPPPGYWLPDPAKNSRFFAVTPEDPVYRKDYEVRRGTAWTFRLTRVPKREPVGAGFASSYHLPGDASLFVSEKTDPNGEATVTLPDEAVKVTISLSSKDREEGMVLVKLDKSHGFRPGAVEAVKRIDEHGEPHFRITDEARGIARVSGPVEPSVERGRLVLTASLPEADPRSFGRITGSVIDRDGRPIAGATVTLYYQYRQWGAISSREEHKVRTDVQGRFVLHSVPRKTHEGDATKLAVVVYKDGYAGHDTATFAFKPGNDGNEAIDPIRLSPGLSMSGRVVDPEGRPVVGAQIQAVGGWAQYASSYRSGTDGRFAIPNLGSGVVRVALTFGKLSASANYVVDGRSGPVTIMLRPEPGRPAAAAARPEPPKPLKIGEPAPNWVVRGWTDGRERSIGELRGRVVYLDFWDLRSGERLLPALDRLREKFEPRGVVFLSIHTPGGSLEQVRKLYELKKVSLVSAIDEGPEDDIGEGMTARLFGVRGFPWSYLIDRSGKVAFSSNDPANQAAMAAIVQRLGIDATKPPTEEQMNRLMEAFLGEVIENVLARP
jgi:RNA polymerase sigma factor (sigma-70 family)